MASINPLPPDAIKTLACYEHVQWGNRAIHIGLCVHTRLITCSLLPLPHLVGGAHLLDQTVDDVETVIDLLKSQNRLAGVFLELCHERTGVMEQSDPEPEENLEPLAETFRRQPLELINVCSTCGPYCKPTFTSFIIADSRFTGSRCQARHLR